MVNAASRPEGTLKLNISKEGSIPRLYQVPIHQLNDSKVDKEFKEHFSQESDGKKPIKHATGYYGINKSQP